MGVENADFYELGGLDDSEVWMKMDMTFTMRILWMNNEDDAGKKMEMIIAMKEIWVFEDGRSLQFRLRKLHLFHNFLTNGISITLSHNICYPPHCTRHPPSLDAPNGTQYNHRRALGINEQRRRLGSVR